MDSLDTNDWRMSGAEGNDNTAIVVATWVKEHWSASKTSNLISLFLPEFWREFWPYNLITYFFKTKLVNKDVRAS